MKSFLKLIFFLFALSATSLRVHGQIVVKDTTPVKKAAQLDTSKTNSKAPTTADSSILKKYSEPRVFISSVALTESTINGATMKDATHPTAKKGQGFDVTGIAANGNLILRMWKWTLKDDLTPSIKSLSDTASIRKAMNAASTKKEQEKLVNQIEIVSKRESLNFKDYGYKAFAPGSLKNEGDNTYYFTLSKESVEQLSTVETKSQNWDINFGVLTTPFKVRFRKFAFTNNAGIGTAVYFEKKFTNKKNWSWGLVPGFSLTSVTLDAASTNVHPDGTATAPLSKNSQTSPITTSTTRPAFTPSLSYVISYKNINFTIGAGFDFISKPTDIATNINPEAGWIYNGKPWLGIGFGVSLFGNNSTGSSTPSTTGQTPKP